MGKIFCLIGKSATGKDTIYQRLLGRKELRLRKIVSYTTRPIRANETAGMEYHFCDEAEMKRLMDAGKIIELRSYHTCHGVWNYFTADDGQIDLQAGDYLMIGTVDSFGKICDYYGKERVLPIYIEVEDGIRLQRALSRERMQKHPKYEEMCRRFLADGEDFSREKLSAAGIERIFYNEDIDRTEEEIAAFIAENL